MKKSPWLGLTLALTVSLAGCGTLPQPFLGHPGGDAARLEVPPPPVLVVPPPPTALLGAEAANDYAADLAAALVAQDIPSLAGPVQKYQWHLQAHADVSNQMVVPAFAIIGPNGKTYGTQEGAPVAEAAWAQGDLATLAASAKQAAPGLAKLLASINASVQQSNPQSLENRPPRVVFNGVSGALGDGDHALALNMRRDLPGQGLTLQDDTKTADFVINGQVSATPGAGQTDTVEIDWFVRDENGRVVGKVTQLHDLAVADMVPYWGDVAAAAAAEAAQGIKQAILNATLAKQKPPAKPPAA
jgi:hypothetical protein